MNVGMGMKMDFDAAPPAPQPVVPGDAVEAAPAPFVMGAAPVARHHMGMYGGGTNGPSVFFRRMFAQSKPERGDADKAGARSNFAKTVAFGAIHTRSGDAVLKLQLPDTVG